MKKTIGFKLRFRPILGINPPDLKKNEKLISFWYGSKTSITGTKGTRFCTLMGTRVVKIWL